MDGVHVHAMGARCVFHCCVPSPGWQSALAHGTASALPGGQQLCNPVIRAKPLDGVGGSLQLEACRLRAGHVEGDCDGRRPSVQGVVLHSGIW